MITDSSFVNFLIYVVIASLLLLNVVLPGVVALILAVGLSFLFAGILILEWMK